jgi:hypothetical protein
MSKLDKIRDELINKFNHLYFSGGGKESSYAAEKYRIGIRDGWDAAMERANILVEALEYVSNDRDRELEVIQEYLDDNRSFIWLENFLFDNKDTHIQTAKYALEKFRGEE